MLLGSCPGTRVESGLCLEHPGARVQNKREVGNGPDFWGGRHEESAEETREGKCRVNMGGNPQGPAGPWCCLPREGDGIPVAYILGNEVYAKHLTACCRG